MNKQLVLALGDFRFVRIHCSHCPTIVTLDLEKLYEAQNRKQSFTPRACPGCDSEYDSAVPILDAFQRSYKALLPIAKRLSFHGQPVSGEV